MKSVITAFAAVLFMAPAVASAHGQAPPAAHGGQVQEAHEYWVELVVNSDQVKLYVLNEAQKTVPASEVSGTVKVLADGKIYKVELAPAERNSLQAKLPVAASGKIVATASLTIDGQAASARFNFGS